MSIDTVFFQVVERFTRKTAICFGNESWSYAQLSATVNQISASIACFNGEARRVATFLEPGPKLIAALLAIIKSNRIFTPLDPLLYQNRIAAILDQATPDLIITTSEWLNVLDAFAKEADVSFDVLLLDELPDNEVRDILKHLSVYGIACGDGNRSAYSESDAPFNDNCYLYYTSGSTGIAKGIVGRQSSLLHFIRWEAELVGMSPADRVSLLTPQTFGPFLREVFLPLLNGGTLCIPDNRAITFDPNATMDWLQHQKITIIHSIPTVFSLILEAARNSPPLASLRYVLLAGETLKPSLAGTFFKSDGLGHSQLINLYEPSETTLAKLYYQVKPEDSAREVIPVGKPIRDTKVYIINSQGREANVGEEGEILISTPYISSGYLNLAEENAQKFVLNSLVPEKNASLVYRTGDIGCAMEDGNIEIRGRMDFQIKIHGQRIELAEIERALDQHSDIKANAVRAFEVGPESKIITAYVVLNDEAVTTDELREYLQAKLPDYMLPQHFVRLDALPLTSNEKIDQKALPASNSSSRQDICDVATPQEELMASLWCDVLNLVRVEMHDNFFELGGNSLLGTHLTSHIRESFGVEIPLLLLFENSIIREFTDAVISYRQSLYAPKKTLLSRQPRPDKWPLSFAQSRLWCLDQLEPENSMYNIPTGYRLEGKLDIAMLRQALHTLVNRHESLRTVFKVEKGEVEQVIFSAGISIEKDVTLSIIDLSDMDGEAIEGKVNQLVLEETHHAFDLIQGPLLRVKLLRLEKLKHILLVTMHHIISDGWSMGVFYQELSELYNAYREDRRADIIELPTQYGDYSQWQREWLTSDVYERQLRYWREQLEGVPSLLPLPTDQPRPPVQRFQGACSTQSLPGALVEDIKALSRQEGCTPFMVFLAVFQLLLYRYTGQEKIAVGTPIANRTHREVEGLIGFFVNTLVMSTDHGGDPTFRTLLKRVREVALGAYDHQDLPFEKLVEALQPEHDFSYTPLFQVMFVYQNMAEIRLTLNGLTTTPLKIEGKTSKFDLTLALLESGNDISFSVEYDTDLFEEKTIERLIAHYKVLLEGVVNSPNSRLSELQLLTQQEYYQIVHEWNNTTTGYAKDQCLHQLFEQQVEKTPNAIAVSYEGQTLSYTQLNAHANQLACALRERGVKPESLVGLYLERSLEMVVALFAVLKAGGAYLPMDIRHPQERLALMLEDAQIELVLTLTGQQEKLLEIGVKTFNLDLDRREIAAYSDTNLENLSTPQNLAYVIYTSGSTGKPKGVQVEHGNIVNFLTSMGREPGLCENDRLLAVTTLSFDIAVLELYLPLINGARVIIASGEATSDGRMLQNLIAEEKITIMQATPTTWRMLLAAGWRGSSTFKVLCGGEAFPKDLAHALLDCGLSVWNMYGPTETTVWSSCFHITDVDAPVLIGRPIDNTSFYVLDTSQHQLPVGVWGELYIGGAGVTRGYLNRADLTAECYVLDPFTDRSDARLYRTGDLVRYLKDGNIEYSSRLDHQVKVRGFRIELGEIEVVLARNEAVRECVAVVHKLPLGDQRIIAYVVYEQAKQCTVTELREFLCNKLPDYMVPTLYVDIDSLPLTSSGKIDRKALPEPPLGRPEQLSKNYETPQGGIEIWFAELWQEIFQIEPIGRHDSFFELGGRSIQAMKFLARVNQEKGCELQVADLFAKPTLAQLALMIEKGSKVSGVVHLGKAPENFQALSDEQRRLCFFQQFNADNPVYNMPYKIKWQGYVNPALLQSALNQIVEDQEALQTAFTTRDEEFSVFVDPDAQCMIQEIDFSSCEDAEQQANQWLYAEARKVFQLEQAPLLRFYLVRLSTTTHWVFVNMHHVIADAWSFDLFWQQLIRTYQALLLGGKSPEHQLPIKLSDYIYWQQQLKSQPGSEQVRQYWTDHLRDSPTLIQLPHDKPQPVQLRYCGAKYRFSIPSKTAATLRQLAKDRQVSLFSVMLAAFKVFLYRYTDQKDLVVGVPVANRFHHKLEPLIGFLVNILCYRSRITDDDKFQDYIHDIHQLNIAALRHKDMPFDELVDLMKPDRNLGHSPLFQVMFAFQERTPMPVTLREAKIGLPLQIDNGTTKYDLTLQLWDQNTYFDAEFEFSTDLFETQTVTRMADNFLTLLADIADQPCQAIGLLKIISQQEQRQLISWNNTQKTFSDKHCIHELISRQAQCTPQATAVIYESTSISHRELDEKSNQLANFLINNGVALGAPVAVSVDRSIDLIVTFLGVLKSGGIYVPVDPDYPLQRRQYMLANSRSRVLITQEKYKDNYTDLDISQFFIDKNQLKISEYSLLPAQSGVNADSSAYIIYTSGSTGQPKGVEIVHRGICNLAEEEVELLEIDVNSRVLQFASFSFDTSIWEIVMTLVSGASLVMADRLSLLPGPDLLHPLKRHRISHLTLPASALAAMPYDRLPDLKVLIVAGEACTLDLLKKWGNGRTFINSYGPTEVTVSATNAKLTCNDLSVHIGRPLANTQIWLLNSRQQLAPIGAAGELYVGGVGLARGYYHKPEITAERFIDNPLPWSDSKILYKTGDLARYLSDGNIEFLGRVDQQVKIRGYRIELTEVEYNLKNCRDVQDAVVLVRDDILEDKCLVAYVTTTVDSSESERSLKNHLAQSLPGYMIPIRILFLDMFPRLPNNKVDRAKLPKPSDLSDTDADQDVLLPNTPEELALAEVWQQLLGLEMICCKQSFFQLGGHSLLAAKAVAKLARDFQLQLSVREFFNQATIQYLAGCCTPLVSQSQMDGITLPLGEWAPFSFAQQRIWFLDQLSPESAQYNICQVKEFSPEYDSALLVEAINQVLQRQDIFCLRFKLMEGLPCQQVNEFPQVRLLEADIQTCSQAEILQQAQKIANTPLRLLDGQHYHLILKRNDRGLLNLIFSIHHLLADEQSLVLFDELIKQMYLVLSNGCREPAEKKCVRYIEFAYWEQKQHQQGAWQSQLDYWQKTLANRPETLPLPFDSIITNDKFITHQGAVHHFSVPNEVCVRLRQVASKGNTTTFVVWLAIFFVYLYRYTGERDIVVGIPVAVRHAPEFEDLLGLFLNTVIIRKSICREDIFTDFLAQLKQTVLQALDHKEIPFDKITDAVQLHRSLDGAPIINVMLVHQIQGKPDAEYAITSSNIENKTAKFDLTLFLSESDGQLQAKFEYRSDKFKQETIAYLSDHLVNLAQQIAKSPDTAITHLELLSAAEKQQLIYDWNRTEQPKAPLSVIEKFEQCAQIYPKRIAAESAGKQITYETLNAKANQLAHYLMDEGIGRELLVAVLLPRGVDLLVALLGILKAGAAYIPIDPNNPQERIQYILQDSSASFVITHSTLANHIVPALHDRVEEPMVFCMDQAQAGLKTKSNDNLGQTVKDHQLAYVIYTSGSTGKPKGVLIEHGGFNNYINFATRYYEVDIGAGNPVHLSIAFDATITSLFTPLTCGQKLILLPEQDEFHHLLNIISEVPDLSFVKMTPAHLDLLNQALPELHRQAAKCFILGGEALNFASIKKWRQVTPEMRIINEYGPTEAVVGCCIYEVGTGKDEHNGIVPIGRPIDNTQLYVLDADLQLLPIGVTGELYIGGAGVARGYLNRKDLNAEKFVANPFVTEPGSERLYKTGDLVKYLPDGNLVYIGRIDDQIKIRGYRVELGEIEAVLADVAGVSEACVVLHAAENNTRKIIAYVVLSDDHSGSEEILRSQLAIQLPEYMVPAKFVILESMPLTQNGKNDRGALALRAVVIEKKSYTAPTNHREEILVKIWQEALQVVKVGITDNFFELGGDSILSLQIVFKARQNGLQLDTRQIFEYQTIAQLAIFVNDADVSAHKQSMSDRQNISGPIPLSPMQYWLFKHKGIGHHHFNQSYLFSVEKILNISCLEQAFLQVINHHMGLRKIFREDKNEDKRWSAEISKPLREFRIETVAINDSRDFSSKEQVQKFSSQVQSDFVLDNPPLIKVVYFKIQNDTLDRLLLVAHHGIIDNVSWQIIFSDIEKIYTALIAKRIPEPLANSTSIRKWIEYFHAYNHSESLQKEYCYWYAMLQDHRQSIPVDFIDGVMNNQVKQAKKLWRRFDIQQTNLLLSSANRPFGTKPNELIAVALATTLAKWMKTDRVKFDVESHGRVDEFEEIDLSRTVGWLTALYPVIVETGSLTDLGKLIKVTKEVFRSVPKLGIGFGVLNYLEPAKELNNTAEICFNYLGNLVENDTCKGLFSQLAEEKIHHKHAPMLQRHYLLEIDAYIVNGELMVEWTYCEHAHHHSTISRLADGLFSDLENTIDYCVHYQHIEYTPADFPRVSLSMSDLEKLQRKHSVIDDLYPMSPVQEGMLFHTLFSPNSTSYFEQLIYAIPQSIQIAQLQTAWQYLLDRHDVLRTCFVWKDVLDPVQIVSNAIIPWFYHDWSSRDKDTQQSRLEALLFEDRLEKFDLEQSPLCRINLIKYGEADYRMIISHHHAILDGWSMMLLLQELQDYYSQLVTGNMVTLSFTAKYREYIKWLQGNKNCGIQYWQETLGSNVSATPLPLSVAREAREDNSRVDLIETYLDEASLNLLEKYAHCHHLTINTLLQGAWALLLHHYTGCNDVIFGMTTSGRSVDIPSIEEMVGLFINTVPVKVSITNDQRIDTWLAQLQISTIAAQQFAHVSLTDIQEKCSTASHKSLFQTIVVFENYPVPEAKNDQVLPLKYLFAREMTNYPLAIVISKSALLKIKIVYDTSIYSHESVQQISRHLSQLLQRLPSSSEKMIRDLSLLDNEERQQVIYHRNQTEIDCRFGLIHEEITAITEQYPDRIALRTIESEVTYRAMDSRANQLAQRLMAQGIGNEDLVAICLYRSIEMVISLLAVLKAGAAYLPVDPGLPEERMAFMIENSAAALLITEKDVPSPEGIQTWILSELGIENSGLDFQLPYTKENHPCYLIYTSGSTGTPKGVVIEHKNLANYLNFARQTYSKGKTINSAVHSSMGFDATITSLYLPLITGGTVNLVSEKNEIDALAKVIAEAESPLLLKITPVHLKILGDKLSAAMMQKIAILIIGGEALNTSQLANWREKVPSIRIINEYGPTETVVGCSIYEIPTGEIFSGSVPIGKPIGNTQLYILDDRLEPVADGVAGELYIAGAGVGRGYLKLDEKTRERFIQNPYATGCNDVMYKSGDLAKYNSAGVIEYIGRSDQQIKMRGHRIEIGEIEAVLLIHPAVNQAVVIFYNDGDYDNQSLIAFVSSRSNAELEKSTLFDHLKLKLPMYMMPEQFVVMDELPMTVNGKINRDALLIPDAIIGEEVSFEAPISEVEKVVCAILEEVLNCAGVGRNHSFFALGGHSLKATRVISRIYQLLDVSLSLRTIFDYPVVKELAEKIDSQRGKSSQSSRLRLQRVERKTRSIKAVERH